MNRLWTSTAAQVPSDMHVRRVNIRDYPVSELAATVRDDYEAKFGEPPADPGGWYHRDDWPRVSFVADLLRPGGSVLDVGVGAGPVRQHLGSVRPIHVYRRHRQNTLQEVHRARARNLHVNGRHRSPGLPGRLLRRRHLHGGARACSQRRLRRRPGRAPARLPRSADHVAAVLRAGADLEDARTPLRSRRHSRHLSRRDLYVARSSAQAVDADGGALRRDDTRRVLARRSRQRCRSPTPTDPRDATIARLRAEVDALKNRKVVRLVDRLGRVPGRVRRWLHR